MLSDISSRNPQLMQVAGDLIMRNADIPGAQEIADRLEKTLPPGLQDMKGNAAAQMGQQLQQLMQEKQQTQMVIVKMQEHIDKLEGDLKGKVIETQGRIEIAKINQRTDAAQGVAQHGIDVYNAETDRMKVVAPAFGPAEVQAVVFQTLQQILGSPQTFHEPGPPPELIQPVNEPPSGGFSLAEPSPEMAATGAQPGLGAEPTLPEGNQDV